MANLQDNPGMTMISFMLNLSETDPTALIMFYKNLFTEILSSLLDIKDA